MLIVAGSVLGQTVVVAAVVPIAVVVVIVAITVVGVCYFWRIIAMLEWCVFGGSGIRGLV
jgi:hypothetical protein